MANSALIGIRAARTWLPKQRFSPADAVRRGWLTAEQAHAHGDVTVPLAGEGESPPEMAARAVETALSDSGTAATDVDLLLYSWTNYQGNDFFSPHHWLADRVGLPDTCVPITVQQACNGTPASLELALSAILADRAQVVAIAGSDRFGAPALDHYRSHPSLAHGDGAVAAVVAAPAPDDDFYVLGMGHATAADLWRTRDTGGLTRPSQSVPDYIDSKPTPIFLGLGGRDLLLARGRECMRAAVDACFEEADVALDDVTALLLPRLSPGVRRLMAGEFEGLFGEAAHSYYAQTGHLGSGDLLANLADIQRDDVVAPDELALVLSAGGGYSYSAILVRRGRP